ncbi:MAG: glycosyltransferase family 9 protein [Candidatus Nitrohelix vancouverensis]|uniref:Glycosyltransferase family 9 protein n=1 Tax=Candidatus Nitrohelix vancouverensis TaxID=2705534 RepID=A0A7T0C2S4_9BACT|nr:MAG: glycosyltransferase family 9 protein [Candidatus Nitrohelix vancouverensis]
MGQFSKALEKQVKSLAWQGIGALVRLCRKPAAQDFEWNRVQSVLVVRPDRLGDVVLSTPVYVSLKRSFPDLKTTALVHKDYVPLLQNHPDIDRTLAYDPKRPWKIARQLRKQKFDLSLTLNKSFSATASVLTLLAGAHYRAGYRHAQNAWLYDFHGEPDSEARHETQNNLELLKVLKAPALTEAPRLGFSEDERQAAQNRLEALTRQPGPPVALIKIGSRVPQWGWSPDKFIEVANALVRENQAQLLFIVGPGEENMMRELSRKMEFEPQILPLMSVRELAALMQFCDLLFCNHTGIMHLASAVQTPLAVIFKHGEIKRWGPVNNRHVILEERNGDDLPAPFVTQQILTLLRESKADRSNPNL